MRAPSSETAYSRQEELHSPVLLIPFDPYTMQTILKSTVSSRAVPRSVRSPVKLALRPLVLARAVAEKEQVDMLTNSMDGEQEG